MTPEESATWVAKMIDDHRRAPAGHKQELREIDRLVCPCEPPGHRRALAVVYAAPGGSRVLWTAPVQNTGQDGTISKSPARATDLDKVPESLTFRIEHVQCPRCRSGAMLTIENGTIKVTWLDAPTRATVTD